MQMLTATSSPISLVPVGLQCGKIKHHGPEISRVNVQTQPFCGGRCKLVSGQSVPMGLYPIERRKLTLHSRCTQSASVICASALNARCAAEQTQTVIRQSPTITHLPGKEKSPQLDDGGTGFPPRDDGDGGGGGGGGGNWSGGFFFFGFLAFLGFLKDKENDESYGKERRRRY